MKILIIGGGASGCYCAVHAANLGHDVTILEKNKIIGKKLRITGKGRCNLTNNCDISTLMRNIPRNSRFLYSAFSVCNPQDVMSYFESLGVALKTERGNRVFPVSNQASEIVETLHTQLNRLHVKIIQDTAKSLIIENQVCQGVQCQQHAYYADKILLAVGGATYPLTGSTGDGYQIAVQAGHTVTELRPSLVPLETLERDCAQMMGISLKNVKLTLKQNQKILYEEQGEMLFTHFGVSGPLVLSASAHMQKAENCMLHIDLKPALTPEQLDKRLQREIAEIPNQQVSNLCRKLVPSNMVMPLLDRCGLSPYLKNNSLTKPQRLRICQELKDFRFTVRGLRPMAEGIITRGGISCKEVNPKTMESKLIQNLYFAGEILDIDAYTGGFNLQIAFATAYLAAISFNQ
ncbi:MAG: NAD(P)/FAD-dependent oxidoreductase [Oscillospiraceae bacterium]|nr:NAD(P)/FAD-dependent oxidoreductase [Oscillospiraceae bacterium]